MYVFYLKHLKAVSCFLEFLCNRKTIGDASSTKIHPNKFLVEVSQVSVSTNENSVF